jgi:hypothetical protein
MSAWGGVELKEGTTLEDLKALFYEITEEPKLEEPQLPLIVETVFRPFDALHDEVEFKFEHGLLEYNLDADLSYDDWDAFKLFLRLIGERFATKGWTHYERNTDETYAEDEEEYFGPDEAARHQAEVDSAWAALNQAQLTYDRALAQQQGAQNGGL